jgi:hypothetical protein
MVISAMKKTLFPFVLLIPLAGFGQNYSIPWYRIGGGGGTSSGANGGAVYSITGTIGQPEAGRTLSGGVYSLTGGFWSLVSVIQTPGLPVLSVGSSGGSVVVSWPAAGSYILQQNANFSASGAWPPSGYSIISAGGTNSITITKPAGNLYFRLASP